MYVYQRILQSDLFALTHVVFSLSFFKPEWVCNAETALLFDLAHK